MGLIDISVKRPVGVIMAVLVAIVIGAVSLAGLPVDLLPDIELPIAVVVTSYTGAAPEEVTNLVTKPMEGVLSTLQGLDTIQSMSYTDQSIIIVMFKFGTKLDQAMLDIRDKVDQASWVLPDDAGDPMIIKMDINAQPIVQLSLSGDMDLERLTQIAKDIAQPELERIAGVAQVSLVGDQVKQINIEANPAKLEGYGISITDITQSVAANNTSVSVGNVVRGSQDMNVRLIGEYNSIRDVENVLIHTATGQRVKLSEIAKVEEAFKDQSTYTFVNQEPALSINVSKQSDANTVQVARDIIKEMDEISKKLPAGASLNVIVNTAEYIEIAIDNVANSLLLGALLAAIVLYLFLRNIRSTLVIAISMPISLVATFMMMYFAGQTINILTMSGLALGVGMMVDSSIVILENIYRYRQNGYGKIEAAIAGAKEVVAPVVASALTTIAAFLPIVFTSGMVSQLFRPLALTISFSLLASLIVAATIVPMLSGRLLRDVDDVTVTKSRFRVFDKLGSWVSEIYPRTLAWVVDHKFITLIITTGLIVGSLALIPLVKLEFIPDMDQGEIMAMAKLPVGTKVEETVAVMQEMENFVLVNPDVLNVLTLIGQGDAMGMGGTESNSATLYVRLKPQSERTTTTNELVAALNDFGDSYPDLEVSVSSASNVTAMLGAPISVVVSGKEDRVLKALADEVELAMKTLPGMTNITNTMAETRPELHIVINDERAAEYGLVPAQIMQLVRTSFNGQTATRIKRDGMETDVFVALPEKDRQDYQQLQTMTLMSPYGVSVNLDAIASFEIVEGPNMIMRDNLEQVVTISAYILDSNLQLVAADIDAMLASFHPPEGYTIELAGQSMDLDDAVSDLVLAFLLAVFLVYSVMAIQFESIMSPFIIMFSLPATVVGVIFGLLVTGQTLSVFGMIGLVMLVGIVVNNAIVLVDYINTLRDRGIERREAIITAGRHRLRPVLMTTLTTVLGMLPISIGIGEGTEMQQSLGTVIVYGLSFSTLITLVLVPVMYIYMDNINQWIGRRFRSSEDKAVADDKLLVEDKALLEGN